MVKTLAQQIRRHTSRWFHSCLKGPCHHLDTLSDRHGEPGVHHVYLKNLACNKRVEMCHRNIPGSVFNRWTVAKVWNQLCGMDAFCLTLNCPCT